MLGLEGFYLNIFSWKCLDAAASKALFKQGRRRTSEEPSYSKLKYALDVVSLKFSSNLGFEVDSSGAVLFLRSFDS